MRQHQGDTLTLHLDWTSVPAVEPAVSEPPCAGAWAAEQRQAFLRLWQELRPFLAAGWVLAGSLPQAVVWEQRLAEPGRWVRTGCTAQLYRPPAQAQAQPARLAVA
jgi:hypothetical protein